MIIVLRCDTKEFICRSGWCSPGSEWECTLLALTSCRKCTYHAGMSRVCKVQALVVGMRSTSCVHSESKEKRMIAHVKTLRFVMVNVLSGDCCRLSRETLGMCWKCARC
jgi:hypothetical protein